MKKEIIINEFKNNVKKRNYIIGVASGSGMTARYVENGGADFILVLNSGKFRQMGRGSLAGFLSYCNGNDMVMEFGSKEILPIVKHIPIFFGINASDPTKNTKEYIEEIKDRGFHGVINYPTIGLIDGSFRIALEEQGCDFAKEVEAIGIAHRAGLLTMAFIFDEFQAEAMIRAGVDIICLHLGLTSGGLLGAKKVLSLESARKRIERIFNYCSRINPEIIKLIYGGPVKTPLDFQYMLSNHKEIDGYIGGSAFERIPVEKAIINVTKSFKTTGEVNADTLMAKMLDGVTKHYNYVDFVKEYISENYTNEIVFSDLAQVAHVSRSYLSTLFKKEVGCSFQEYLIRFRMDRAAEIIINNDINYSEIANLVAYKDYAQFSKMFKKYKGLSPKKYKEKYNINT
ncbi:phosphoenolpyruvate hydrolase family protein [Alloiococcus sp. CFN-8]|uniref:phosphoenolpyruvate hydrolase family protein n=1 Tax=Alloiococcus sp. CFN-8 TaxID=3416081 RepID=UPI003CE81651